MVKCIDGRGCWLQLPVLCCMGNLSPSALLGKDKEQGVCSFTLQPFFPTDTQAVTCCHLRGKGHLNHTAWCCAEDAKSAAVPMGKGPADQSSAWLSLKARCDGGGVNEWFLKPKWFVKCCCLGKDFKWGMGCLEHWGGNVFSAGLAAGLRKKHSHLNYPPSPGCVFPEILIYCLWRKTFQVFLALPFVSSCSPSEFSSAAVPGSEAGQRQQRGLRSSAHLTLPHPIDGNVLLNVALLVPLCQRGAPSCDA